MNDERDFARANSTLRRPNIIFLLTDDHRWDALGAMGNKIIKTPNLDSLAAVGILYLNAYCTTSICCVSRASILSGQYQSRHKINDFTSDFSDRAIMNTYPILLKKSGYQIGFIGKFGIGGVRQPDSLFDYWSCPKEDQPDYEIINKSGKLVHHTDSIGSNIKVFLQKFSRKTPFCLSVSFKAPHELDGNPPTYPVQKRFKNLYSDIPIDQPLTSDPRFWDSQPNFFKSNENIGRTRWKPLLSTAKRHQETVRNYYRLISGVDQVVGDLLKQLKELDIEDNTVIVFMGDNGFLLGEHGLEGKWFGFEESIRVPLIISGAGIAKGIKSSGIALNIDIAPTFLALAGQSIPEQMQGRDLLRKENNLRQDFFYEHTFLGSPQIPKVEGVVSKDFKYMKYIEYGYEEFYDLGKDQYETKNQIKNDSYKKKIEHYRIRYNELKSKVK
ncbi:sulfatase-like hydrolase/transferase [Dyadobacter sp. CY356]|uniref:sulfatase-like hydrolase/transferase n=1 Tax=Dyadobacter sp. CY356 TaxID=2906442 RepID=UPI001F41F620|nr:sulfatase-like hydrolase/transferase [Dyadobacter sp. CY356]